MTLASQFFALLAALLHVFIFCMQSLWFMNPAIHRRFGVHSVQDARVAQPWAFNQGFYNLLLALAVGAGLASLHMAGGDVTVGRTLVLFGCGCMLGAALVLLGSGGSALRRAAIIQGLCPLLAWLFWLA